MAVRAGHPALLVVDLVTEGHGLRLLPVKQPRQTHPSCGGGDRGSGSKKNQSTNHLRSSLSAPASGCGRGDPAAADRKPLKRARASSRRSLARRTASTTPPSAAP